MSLGFGVAMVAVTGRGAGEGLALLLVTKPQRARCPALHPATVTLTSRSTSAQESLDEPAHHWVAGCADVRRPCTRPMLATLRFLALLLDYWTQEFLPWLSASTRLRPGPSHPLDGRRRRGGSRTRPGLRRRRVGSSGSRWNLLLRSSHPGSTSRIGLPIRAMRCPCSPSRTPFRRSGRGPSPRGARSPHPSRLRCQLRSQGVGPPPRVACSPAADGRPRPTVSTYDSRWKR